MKKQETGNTAKPSVSGNIFTRFLNSITGLFRGTGVSEQPGVRLRGKVKWFSNKKGYGFITSEAGKEIFVHHSAIHGKGYKTLNDGQEVEFEVRKGSRGDQAVNVTKR